MKKFKTKQDLIAIKHIYPQFGTSKAKLIVHIYKDKKKMELFEHESLLKKHKFDGKKPEKKKVKEEPKKEEETEQVQEKRAEVGKEEKIPAEKKEHGHPTTLVYPDSRRR